MLSEVEAIATATIVVLENDTTDIEGKGSKEIQEGTFALNAFNDRAIIEAAGILPLANFLEELTYIGPLASPLLE